MIRSPATSSGFSRLSTDVTSACLTNAVAASLAIGALSLCLIVALTVFSINVSVAMPFPA